MIFKLNNWILYIDVLSGVFDGGVAQGTALARALFTSKYKMLLSFLSLLTLIYLSDLQGLEALTDK